MSVIYPPGHRLGKNNEVEIQDVISRSRHTIVYRAKHVTGDGRFIVKSHPEPVHPQDEMYLRFRREGDCLMRIRHPSIAVSKGSGISKGVVYNVQDLIDGPNLARVLRNNGALSERVAVRFARHAAEGLTVAHEADIIHRDVKPENIIIRRSDRSAVLIDFGFSRFLDESVQVTMPGTVIGTSGYMSPEQLNGFEATTASDVFSLGVVLYEMVAGIEPFDRPSTEARDRALRKEPHPPLKTKAPGASPALEQLVDDMLIKRQRRRIQTANEVHQRLSELGDSMSQGD